MRDVTDARVFLLLMAARMVGDYLYAWGGEESDFRAIHEGYVSVTPLHLDLTNYELLEEVGGWSLGL